MNIRVGFGYDVHRLEAGEVLHLGGVNIPSKLKAVGHSDADVLLHAICDALLGAAGMQDIGFHFPDTDPQYKGINSLRLLESVRNLISEKGYRIGNIDASVVLEAPKIAPHVSAMKSAIAGALIIPENQIGIKATTNEQVGFIGRGEGVAAFAVSLVYQNG